MKKTIRHKIERLASDGRVCLARANVRQYEFEDLSDRAELKYTSGVDSKSSQLSGLVH